MIRRKQCKPFIHRLNAMTLIELLIVLAIIGLLAAFVYPSYTAHVRSAHRHQALSDLSRIQLYLEQHYRSGYHAGTVISAGICLVCDSDPSRYQFSVSASTQGYQIRALPQTATRQHLDTCQGQTYEALTLNHLGESAPPRCWR
ncbi:MULTISPECIES: type IV pilin protein [Vibrio]|uniref:Uncharacterized protein n=1 Tax=Vibrio proteolyticus NBRC 13287 TaxID=1219065 RepID=U3BQ48_VIBPR|nr:MULTISPECIES: type IV pilin protein [Vibrio]NAW56624.1 prepilin-type N-terminal cleavage/methylation domain-containing protein [Vibrio sp. V36_P2S2PM302]NAX27261.1 prepilin-type N-terminal cleavage/methylation domain-containing protein [Vibrio sp. V38_P2S17PM301]NAX28730.1 prepilin-type N-terminal cleavage/methylation domain-containing protein [Vibrio sp. V37_P2S8PM304]GAD68668.1 hypothetical protein VPR01S_18_00710 [Vibrio proteolyticus NBRC 13287]